MSLWKDRIAPHIDQSGKVDVNQVPNGTDKEASHVDAEANSSHPSTSHSESVASCPSHRAGSKRKATEGYNSTLNVLL